MKKFSEFKKPTVIKKGDNLSPKRLILEEVEKNDVEVFFSKLFESREMAHVYHLQVKGDEGSHAKHLALGEYYEGILEMIDSAIEVYQGQYELLENYDIIDTNNTKEVEPQKYFEDLGSYIMENKNCISDKDTHIHSLIDDITCLIYKTLYKLKFNK